jgi:hypothetical protein
VRPDDWPRYLLMKRLKSGVTSYYWNPPPRDINAGFTLSPEALGQNLVAACERAAELNRHLDAWRKSRGAEKNLDLQPRYGTVDWLIERYYRSRAFEKVSKRTKPDYRYSLALVADVKTKRGGRFGELHVGQISAAVVDRLYTKHLLHSKDRQTKAGKVLPGRLRRRQAELCIVIMKQAWNVVARLYPKVVAEKNPWVGVTLEGGREEIVAATREEAFALSAAIAAYGHPHLAAVPVICFEWLQRPENVLAGHLAWHDVRAKGNPKHVRIDHHKTGKKVLQPLEDHFGRLFPELEDYLAQLQRLGLAIVLTPGARGKPRPYSFSYAKRIAREARRKAGLPEHVTMTACRHGGMTELGDAELTEQQTMALSGHATPEAARLYVKRTETQRALAARRRRAWVEKERTDDGSQNDTAAGMLE